MQVNWYRSAKPVGVWSVAPRLAGALASVGVVLACLAACRSADTGWEARRDAQRRAMVESDEARRREFERRMQPEYLRLASLQLSTYEMQVVNSTLGAAAGTFEPYKPGAYGPSDPGSKELIAGLNAARSNGGWEDAVELFNRAAEMGNSRACLVLALYHVQRDDFSQEEVRALLSQAAVGHDPIGLLLTARLILDRKIGSSNSDVAGVTIEAIERGAVLDGCEILEQICAANPESIDWQRLGALFSKFAAAYGTAQAPPAVLARVLLRSPTDSIRQSARSWLEARVSMWRTRYYVAPFAFALGSRLIERGSSEAQYGRELLELAARGKSKEAADLLVEAFLGNKGIQADRESAYRWCLIRQGMGGEGRYDCARIREGVALAARAQAQIDATAFSSSFLP
jgi:hypothetical protein